MMDEITFLDMIVQPKTTSANVLNVIKSQYINADRFSANIFEDVAIAKNVFDNLYVTSKDTVIKGFIQEIRMNKFGILFYTEKQVKSFFLYSKLPNSIL